MYKIEANFYKNIVMIALFCPRKLKINITHNYVQYVYNTAYNKAQQVEIKMFYNT